MAMCVTPKDGPAQEEHLITVCYPDNQGGGLGVARDFSTFRMYREHQDDEEMLERAVKVEPGDRLTLSVLEAARLLGIGRNTCYKACKRR